MMDYFYPVGPKKPNKKAVNELLSPDQALQQAMQQAAAMKQNKTELLEKNNGKLLTNDGREMLNEQ